MKILAIDTSMDVLVITYGDEDSYLSLTYRGIERHATKLAPLTKHFLELARIDVKDIDFLGCGIGPGSLTGLRIGISFIQGLAVASKKKIVPVVSANVLSRNFYFHDGEVVVVRKAREGYVYIACYKNEQQILEPTIKEVDSAREFVKSLKNPLTVGDAKALFADISKLALDALEKIDGKILLEEVEKAINKGQCLEPALVQPLYLQKSIAEMNFEKKQG